MSLLRTLGPLAAAAGGYALAVRPRLLRWGAEEAEIQRPLPGDEIVPVPGYQSTRAVTLHAAPSDVWPWIAQMGLGRGGLYLYGWLEGRAGVRSADRLHPEWQHLRVGEPIRVLPGGDDWPDLTLEVARVEGDRALVLRSPGSRGSARESGLPYLSWAWVLEPVGPARTRLLVRTRGELPPQPLPHLVGRAFVEPLHFLLEERMLRGLRARAEGSVVRRAEATRQGATVH